jgi:integrase
MPLKVVPPRTGKSPNYTIRGTYLGVRVDRTAGTPDLKTARRVKKRIETEIERGALEPRGGKTFAVAALAYLRAGADHRFIDTLAAHFGNAPLARIDQTAIDEAAHVLYPDASPATRNRQVYTPMSAILKHAGVRFELRRPKGSAGQATLRWLWPEQAEALFEAADDPEFRAFLITLCYTGLRLSEAIWLRCDAVRLSEAFAYLPTSKNDQPRALYLPPVVVAELANHPRGLERSGETVFRFRKNGHLYTLLKRAKTRADLPWVTFHTFCHTYGTWMRRYGGLDTRGLVGTGRWKSEKSAARYAHVLPSEDAMRAALLPTPKTERSG